jgi:hypothetical protein
MKNSLIENPNSGNMLPPLTNTLEFFFFQNPQNLKFWWYSEVPLSHCLPFHEGQGDSVDKVMGNEGSLFLLQWSNG